MHLQVPSFALCALENTLETRPSVRADDDLSLEQQFRPSDGIFPIVFHFVLIFSRLFFCLSFRFRIHCLPPPSPLCYRRATACTCDCGAPKVNRSSAVNTNLCLRGVEKLESFGLSRRFSCNVDQLNGASSLDGITYE